MAQEGNTQPLSQLDTKWSPSKQLIKDLEQAL
jgi:hypothetical protein